MGSKFLEQVQIVSGILPLDLQTARSGDYVSLKNYKRCAVVIFKGVGTAGDDPDFTFHQATAVAGTGEKDLNVTTIYKKQGTLTSVGTWTEVTQSASGTFSADATSAEEEAIYVVDFDASDLDVANGFDCLCVKSADVGTNAQLGAALYFLYEPRYPQAPASMLTAITD